MTVRLGVAQLDCVTGDLAANAKRCLRAIEEAKDRAVGLLVLPELCLTGLSVDGRVPELALTLDAPELAPLIDATNDGPAVMIGFIEDGGAGAYYNATAYIERGRIVHVQRKIYLPNYGIFNEGRTFIAGDGLRAFDTGFGRAAMLICEDAWHPSLPYIAVQDGATLLLTTSASPAGGTSTALSSAELWLTVNRASAVVHKCVNVYANRVGGEGKLSYWGGSHILAPSGALLAQAKCDVEDFITADVDLADVARERFAYRYVQDERLDITQRELRRVARARWSA